MKKYNTVPELMQAPLSVFQTVMLGADADDKLAMSKTTFEDYFGGAVYVAENDADLDDIPSSIFDSPAGELIPISKSAGSFDICQYTKDGEFVYILLIATDAGGDLYFIPKEIAERFPTVMESLES